MAGKIDFKSQLNEDQYAAVTAPYDKPALVLAGAGSGKTRTLVYRVAHFIEECGIYPQELLLLTFTNKASREMLQRVEALTGVEQWRFWGGTFHSVGNKFLRMEGSAIGLDSNFTILDAEDSEKLLKHTVSRASPRFFSAKENPKAGLLKEIISYARNTCLSIEDCMYERFAWLETDPKDIEKIAKAYEIDKRESNLCDFDDLLELWHKLLLESPETCKRYSQRFKNVLVDEYQDTNTLQCKILDLLCCSGRISAVGDDAQCIYSWRGANIDNILKFKQRYPEASIYKVGRNYRSTPQILNFANRILDDFDTAQDFKKELVSSRPASKKPIVIKAIDSQTQARIVADFIEELTMGSGAIYKPSDIAVLYRAHFQAMDMQLQMQYRNIPFAITSGMKFFEQAHIKDVVSQIKFAANPRDFVSFARFMKFLPKIGEKTVIKIFNKALDLSDKKGISICEALCQSELVSKIPEVSKGLYASCAASLLDVNCSIKSSRRQSDSLFDTPQSAMPPKEMVRVFCEGWYVEAMKSTYEDWQDRQSDFDSLYEYASRFPDVDAFLASASLEMGEGAGNGDEGYGDRVSLMTVHQAKGLEFPVVFVIGAAEGLFPLERCIEEGTIDEERRLFYVACTRAKDFLIITYPRISFGKGHSELREPSRFWDSLDRDLYERNS